MLKNIKAVLKGIGAIVGIVIAVALIAIIGPLVLLAGIICLALFIGYVVYYINKEAPEIISELKAEFDNQSDTSDLKE